MSHFLLVIGVIGLTLALVNVDSLARASSSHRRSSPTLRPTSPSTASWLARRPCRRSSPTCIPAEGIYTIHFEIAPLIPEDVVVWCNPLFTWFPTQASKALPHGRALLVVRG